jgi:hypothetical protein
MHKRSPGSLTSVTGIIFLTTHGLAIDIVQKFTPSTVYYKINITSWLIANGMISTSIHLTVMDEQRLWVCENMAMRKLFRPEWKIGAKLYGKLCNEVLHGLLTSPDIVRMMKEKEVE